MRFFAQRTQLSLQSQTVLENARKDLTEVVSQAQKELTKLTTDVPEQQVTSEAGSSSTDTDGGVTPTDKPTNDGEPESSAGGDAADEATTPTSSRHARGPSVSVAAQNLFSRLQSALPSDLAATVQAKLPESIKQGAGAVDFAQLRTTLAGEFQRVQGITRAQAEEYVHKSEELLRDAGEFLKEAVKVVPPEEGAQAVPGVMWDGSDIWMLPEFNAPSNVETSAKGKGKARDGAEGLRAVATRAEALLKQLKHDPEVIRVDPEADDRAKQMWDEWHQAEVQSKEDGVDGKEFMDARNTALIDPVDGEALKQTMDALGALVSVSFIAACTKYARSTFLHDGGDILETILLPSLAGYPRRATAEGPLARYVIPNSSVVIPSYNSATGTQDNEEEFDWESDDDEATVQQKTEPTETATKATEEHTPSIEVPAAKASVASTPATGSPPRRLSSDEDSYDVVSSQVSNNEEAKEDDTKVTGGKKTDAKDDDEEDSDWE